jgi:hypothetical protein
MNIDVNEFGAIINGMKDFISEKEWTDVGCFSLTDIYKDASEKEIKIDFKKVIALIYEELQKDSNLNYFIFLLPDNYNPNSEGHFICIEKKDPLYESVLYDPLTKENAKKEVYKLINDIRKELKFLNEYGTQSNYIQASVHKIV